MALALGGLARVVSTREEPRRAAQLYAASAALREALGAPVAPADRADHERRLAHLSACLGEEAFASAWSAGQAMTLDEVVAFALEDDRLIGGRESTAAV
jgi:hypothetical protein